MFGEAWARKLTRKKIISLLGDRLKRRNVVHYVDHNPYNRENRNLVVCDDQAYHNILHRRERAIQAGFPPYYRSCIFCHQFDDPKEMIEYVRSGSTYHHKCLLQNRRDKRRERSSSGRFASSARNRDRGIG